MNPSRCWLLGAQRFMSSSPSPKDNLNQDGKIFPLSKGRVGVSPCRLLSPFSHTKS